jgi:nitrogen regulatory protein P-II 2
MFLATSLAARQLPAQKATICLISDLFADIVGGTNYPQRPRRIPVASSSATIPALARHEGAHMKLVMAIIKPFKLEDVRDALNAIGIHGMTVGEVKGYGRQKGHTEIYRGAEYAVNFLPKLKVEVAVEDQMADKAISAIGAAAKTGQIGDGKIFVYDLGHAVRIRTGETDNDAL